MAELKITELDELTTPAAADLLEIVDDVAGTPTSKKVTLENIYKHLAIGSDADGDMYYRASGVLARLAKGTAGQVIRMNSGATAPEWATTTLVDLTLGTDHTWTGFSATMTYGEDAVFGDALYLKSDGKWWKAKADAAATMPCMALAGEDVDESEEASGIVLLPGSNQFIRDDTWDWAPGGLIYVSAATAGALTQTLPSSSEEQAQIVGYAYTADIMVFYASPVIVEVA